MKHLSAFAASAAFTLALPVEAHTLGNTAESDSALPETGSADRIIITGTRSREEPEEQPYTVNVISREQIERELPSTVPEALTALPGVLVQRTAPGHGSPYIRGFTGNRTLLVIDGVRYNNATFRDGANEYFAQIDSLTLDQIEVISGPTSALFGSEAVGGVISLRTRGTGAFEREGAFAGAEQTVRISSGDASIASRTAFNVGDGGQWGLRVGATVREYGDIRAADLGRLRETGYGERAFDARADVLLSPEWSATLNHQSLWQDDVPRTHSTIFSVPFAGTISGTDLQRDKDHERSLTYLKFKRESDLSQIQSLEFTLSHQARTEDEIRVRSEGEITDQSFDSDLYAFNAVARSDLAGLSLTYGIDLSRERFDSARTDIDAASGLVSIRLQGPVGTDARYDQAGVFVRGSLDLSPRFSLEGGARYSVIDMAIGQFADPITDLPRAFEGNWSNLSTSLRALFALGGHTVWAGYSRSFRAPNVADVSRFGRSRSSEIEVASLDLEPETFDTFEIGYRAVIGAIELGAGAYTTRLNNYIATVPTGRMRDGLVEVAKANAAAGTVSGVEASLKAGLGGDFAISANATWLRGRLTVPTANGLLEEPISRIQPLTGNMQVSWTRGVSWAVAELTLSDRADELSSGDLLDRERIPPGGTPAYTLLNLRGGTEIAQRLFLTISLNNLLDEAYRTHGSGNNLPGRHAVIGFRLSL